MHSTVYVPKTLQLKVVQYCFMTNEMIKMHVKVNGLQLYILHY